MPLRSPAATARARRLHRPSGAALLLAVLLALWLMACPALAADFIDAAERRVVLPDQIARVLPAEPNAEVLVYVLARDKMVGFRRGPGGPLVPPPVRLVGGRPAADPAALAQTARRLRADVIIDAAGADPQRAAFADQVTQLSGIPYVLLDDSFARIPDALRTVGALLGVADRAQDLSIYAEHAFTALRGSLLIRPATSRPRVYYGRRPDGLETTLPGARAGATIAQAGAINVAAPLGRGRDVLITRQQLLAWNPDIIIAERRSFYDALYRDPAWRGLSAVRSKKVYLAPGEPFGWIDDPAGINRLIGVYWLATLFYADETQEDLRAVTRDFYQRFYGTKLTDAQLEAMVRPAGAQPPPTVRPLSSPMLGLGGAGPVGLGGAAGPGTAGLPGMRPPGRRGGGALGGSPGGEMMPSGAPGTVPGIPAPSTMPR